MTTSPKKLQWVNILFFSLTGLGALILTPLYLYLNGFSWSLLALFFIYVSFTSMSITAGYHRFLSHRSYEANPIVKLAFLLFGAGAFQGSALQWSADHRRHHRHVDTEKDPHNIHEGFLWAHIGWLFYEEPKDMQSVYPEDLLQDKLVMWQHRNYVVIAITMCFGLPLAVGFLMGSPFGGLLFGGLLRVVAGSHSTFLINSYAHTFGRRTYSEIQTARDSLLLAIFAFGEGYHNYHHQFASDYRNGIRWYQWDPTKWLIGSLALVGLTTRLKKIPAVEIQKARLRAEERSLLSRGFPAERIEMLKHKREAAQLRIKEIREEWARLKADMRAQSREKYLAMKANYRERFLKLKAERKANALERKAAIRQWSVYLRTWRRIPVPVVA